MGQYSVDGGKTWTRFRDPSESMSWGQGQVAVAADGSSIVWNPADGTSPVYSTDRGQTWTAVAGLPTGVAPVADPVRANTYYAIDAGTGVLYRSTDGGKTFASAATGLTAAGNDQLQTIPGHAGELYFAAQTGGLMHSTDGGTTWTQVDAAHVSAAYAVGEGAAAPGSRNQTLYMVGTVASVTGFYMSADLGKHWTKINSARQNFGWIPDIVGDPNHYGRVYLGTNGRGIQTIDVSRARVRTSRAGTRTRISRKSSMASLHDVTRGRLLYGGDYNPEQWPPHVWDEDVRLMRDAGVNLVTVGVFAWAALQPAPDRFTFDWLDTVLGLLHDGGIGVALATPTASPPPWLGHRHPDTLPQGPDGIRRLYGSRNQYCPCAPAYRQAALTISAAVAARYAHHPALRLWHIGNEYGTTCHCGHCAGRFRGWLSGRYGDLDGLNAAWGTAVWSQRYGDWAEVLPPRRVQYVINPLQDLDYQRFCDDMLLECFTAERDAVRAHNPAVPVTTNFMDSYRHTDGWRWAAAEDLVSLDTYPDPNDPDAAMRGRDVQGHHAVPRRRPAVAARRAVTRRRELAAGGHPETAGPQPAVVDAGRRPRRRRRPALPVARIPAGRRTRARRDGAARRPRLRACSARSRRWAGSSPGCPMWSVRGCPPTWRSSWTGTPGGRSSWTTSRTTDSATSTGSSTTTRRCGGTTSPATSPPPAARSAATGSSSCPNLYQVSAADAAHVTEYVAGGGTLVVGPFSGITDRDERVHTGGWPGPWLDLLGVRVEEHWPLPDGELLDIASSPLGDFTATMWAEWTVARGADTVASVRGGPLHDRPMVLRHRYGAGTAWYVATLPSPDALRRLLRRVAPRPGSNRCCRTCRRTSRRSAAATRVPAAPRHRPGRDPPRVRATASRRRRTGAGGPYPSPYAAWQRSARGSLGGTSAAAVAVENETIEALRQIP